MAICEICKEKEAKGTVGSTIDPDYIQWVCEDCYYNVLDMKPLSEHTPEEIQEFVNKCNQSEHGRFILSTAFYRG